MIISVRVPADVFHSAAHQLKTDKYYVLHATREEVLIEMVSIRRFGMAANISYPIIRVMNEENESEWFLSMCGSIQENAVIFSYDILLDGIIEVTNQATLDLLNVTPYRPDDAWWNIVEERARGALRAHDTEVGIQGIHLVDYLRPHRDDVDSLVDVGSAYAYQSFLSLLHSQPSSPIGFVPSDYVTSGAPIIKVEDKPRFEEPKDTKPQMSINELLFGGD